MCTIWAQDISSEAIASSNFAAGSRARKGICLVPVADLLNHYPQQHVAWHTGRQGADAFQIITYKEVAKASLLLLS